ncbi:MAG: glycosyltransferase family 39 protein [Acidobacteriota bacterium]|nr:glycosyltransferase family 39 protein [Acidobacteriota bacterium]
MIELRRTNVLAAGIAIVLAFLALNYRAYDGFFQDDELDNISWAPSRPMAEFAVGVLKPVFDRDNFRPPGHLYFALMGRAFGMDFPPYMTPIFAIHLINAALLFFLMRKLGIKAWCALAGAAFFTLSATAFDAYWKPMYVFDLLCTMFSLASILLFVRRQWVLSFVAFWLAYKSKELAVMLPAVLLIYEYWLGERRFIVLIPFFIAALSFGLQGILLNPNRDNEYTFHFTLDALRKTVPFYSERFLFIPYSALLLFGLALTRDRRVWFGLAAMVCFAFVLLFLPGRLYEAYAYLPFACAIIALTAAASKVNAVWLWVVLAIWLPFDVRQLRREQVLKLSLDDQAYTFVEQVQGWARRHPAITTLVYDGAPPGLHDWGVTAAWNIAHATTGLPALFHDWPQAAMAIERDTVAFATRDGQSQKLSFQIHSPSK